MFSIIIVTPDFMGEDFVNKITVARILDQLGITKPHIAFVCEMGED